MNETLYNLFAVSSGLCTDTRHIKKDCLFICLRGANFNGNEYAWRHNHRDDVKAMFVLALLRAASGWFFLQIRYLVQILLRLFPGRHGNLVACGVIWGSWVEHTPWRLTSLETDVSFVEELHSATNIFIPNGQSKSCWKTQGEYLPIPQAM